LQVESKEKMKRRGLKSPNLFDAFVLTFAGGGSIASGVGATDWGKADVSKYRAPNIV